MPQHKHPPRRGRHCLAKSDFSSLGCFRNLPKTGRIYDGLCNGIGSAAGIMVGHRLGAGQLELGKAYGIKLKNISYVIGFASAMLSLPFPWIYSKHDFNIPLSGKKIPGP